MSILKVARRYYELGLTPIPCEPRSKKPACAWAQWEYRRPSWEELEVVWRDAIERFGDQINVATILGKAHGLCAVDIDNPEAFKQARNAIGLTERDLQTWATRSHRGGALIFRYPNGYDLPSKTPNELWGAELLGNERILVLPPSIHPKGTVYRWLKGHEPDQIPLADIPEPLLFAFIGERPKPTPRSVTLPQNGHGDGNGLPLWAHAVVALLQPYWHEGWRHDTALALAGTFAKRGIPKETAEAILRQLTQTANDLEAKDRLRALMDTYERLAEGESVLAWQGLERILDEDALKILDRLLPNPPRNGHHPTLATIERPERPCTDLGNAERLVRLFGDRIRFVPQWGWLVWENKRWVRDNGNQRITELAEETVRQIYREAAETNNPDERAKLAKWAIASESRQRIAAMIDLAAPMCLAFPDNFDADDWLLNLENGTLDLQTFEFMPHNPNLKLTKLAPVTYDPNADCPKWKAFLQRIFNNNERLIRFVQRAVGYSLTGSTREQCLFFLHGTGANGKSTFLEVIRALLGDYAVTAEFSTFVADRKNSVRNDIARLHSARLVTAIEVGEGKRFAEELIKTLTGGDTVAARFLYREFFEFKPRFKVWLAANYKPEIRGTDYAIWRRIRLIPFTVTIPPEEQIPDLAEQLKEELSGILNWALEGLRDWLANGLQPPPEVTEATEAYRAEMDIVGLFVQDACVTDPKAVTPSKTLYEAFREWCAENGYEPFGQTAFGRRLAAKGFSHILTYVNGRRCRCWVGIRLRSDADPQPDLLSPDLTGDGTDGTDGTRFSESCPTNSDADQSFGNSCSICSICSVPPQPDPFPPDQPDSPDQPQDTQPQSLNFTTNLPNELGDSLEVKVVCEKCGSWRCVPPDALMLADPRCNICGSVMKPEPEDNGERYIDTAAWIDAWWAEVLAQGDQTVPDPATGGGRG
jgi:putative DNA primase/helicase